VQSQGQREDREPAYDLFHASTVVTNSSAGRIPEGRPRALHQVQRPLDRGRGANRTRPHGQAAGRRPRGGDARSLGPGQGFVRRNVPRFRCFGYERGKPFSCRALLLSALLFATLSARAAEFIFDMYRRFHNNADKYSPFGSSLTFHSAFLRPMLIFMN
jgi:hypothetical protein